MLPLVLMSIREMRRDFESQINEQGIAGEVARRLQEKGMRGKDGRELIKQALRRWEPSQPQRTRSDLFGLALSHVEDDPEWKSAADIWEERTGMRPSEWREAYWEEEVCVN